MISTSLEPESQCLQHSWFRSCDLSVYSTVGFELTTLVLDVSRTS